MASRSQSDWDVPLVQFWCSACAQPMQAESQHRGSLIPCPRCGVATMIPLGNPHRSAPLVDPGEAPSLLDPGAEYRPVQSAACGGGTAEYLRPIPLGARRRPDRFNWGKRSVGIASVALAGLLVVVTIWFETRERMPPVAEAGPDAPLAAKATPVPFQPQPEQPANVSLEELAARRRAAQRKPKLERAPLVTRNDDRAGAVAADRAIPQPLESPVEQPAQQQPQPPVPMGGDVVILPPPPIKANPVSPLRFAPADFNSIALPGGDQFKQRDIELPDDWQSRHFPRDGLVYTSEHSNGQLQGLYSFDGPKLDGAVATFHDSGELASLGFFRDGQRDGAVHLWDEQSRRILYAEYVRDARQGFLCLFVKAQPRLLQRWMADSRNPATDEYLVTVHNLKPEARRRANLDKESLGELNYLNVKLAELLERMRTEEMTVKRGLADWYREEVEVVRRQRASRLSANAREQMLAIRAAGRARMAGQHRTLLQSALRMARQQ